MSRKSRKLVAIVCAAAAAIGASTVLSAQSMAWETKRRIEANNPRPSRGVEGATVPRGEFEASQRGLQPRALGTIQYDNGIANMLPAVSSRMFGNRFDSALNPAGTAILAVQASGSVTMVSFYLVSVGGTAAFVSVADQLNTTAGTAMNITSVAFNGLSAPGFNTVTFGPALNYVGSSFLAGVWYFGNDVPGLGTGTNMGQGIHGVDINDGASTLTGFNPSNSFNALVRVSGNTLTPVELMSFELVDD